MILACIAYVVSIGITDLSSVLVRVYIYCSDTLIIFGPSFICFKLLDFGWFALGHNFKLNLYTFHLSKFVICSFLHVSVSTLHVCLACLSGPDRPMQADPLSAT